jgi:hypothetical protein
MGGFAMIKKVLLILFFVLLTTGCGTVDDSNGSNDSNGSSDSVEASDIQGYWLQIERDWDGELTDLTDNPYAYLEITDEQLFFYTISFDEDEGYGVASKYYMLEANNIYYDYEELGNRSTQEIAESLYGGAFIISFSDNNLVLLEYNNGINMDDGYEKDTYKKIDASDWPIEE